MTANQEIENRVIAKIRRRRAIGRMKYGTTIWEDMTFEEWCEHLQGELLDAAIYTEKLMRVHHKPRTPEQSPKATPRTHFRRAKVSEVFG